MITHELEGPHHVFTARVPPEMSIVDLLVEVFKYRNEMRSWPGNYPDSRKKVRELLKQGGLTFLELLADGKSVRMIVRRGKKGDFTMIHVLTSGDPCGTMETR